MRFSTGLHALLLSGLLAAAAPAAAQLPMADIQKILVTLPQGVKFRTTGHQLKAVLSRSDEKSEQALDLEIARLTTLPNGREKAALRIARTAVPAYDALSDLWKQPQTRISAAPALRLCSLAGGPVSGAANWTIQSSAGTFTAFKTSISTLRDGLPRCGEDDRGNP